MNVWIMMYTDEQISFSRLGYIGCWARFEDAVAYIKEDETVTVDSEKWLSDYEYRIEGENTAGWFLAVIRKEEVK